jgi:hypothetical protein
VIRDFLLQQAEESERLRLSEGDSRARELASSFLCACRSLPQHGRRRHWANRPFTPDRTSLQLHAEVARKAVVDAGLRLGDIDGVLTAGTDYPTYCRTSRAPFSANTGAAPAVYLHG